MAKFYAFATVLSCLLLAACGQQQAGVSQEEVLATIGSHEITLSQLEVASERSVGRSYSNLNEDAQQKLLDSVVSAQAMASIAEFELGEDELRKLDYQVAAFRQEQLVRLYLKHNAVPQPVSQQQVEQYYENHPEEFGGGLIADVSILQCDIEDSQVCLVKMKVDQLAKWKDIKAESAKYVRRSLNSLVEGDTKLIELAMKTKEKKYSSVKSDEFKISRLYVHEVKKVPPEPLVSVSHRIREKLAPLQLKKAIREAALQARAVVQSETN